MRALFPIIALAIMGCGNGKDEDTDTGPLWVTDTGPTTSTGSTSSGSGGSGSGGSGSGGSGAGAVVSLHVGTATIDAINIDWDGTETLKMLTASAGDTLCEWTWTTSTAGATTSGTGTTTGATTTGTTTGTTTTPPAPIVACTDADGNACDFAFEVELTNGLQTFGNCSTFGLPSSGGVFHYGYISDFQSGGMGYGADFLYYLPYTSTASPARWYPVVQSGVGTTTYDDLTGTLEYELPKTLLNATLP
jgi:hypothetical protein